MTAPHSISSECATALGLLQDSSCFRGEVCSTLPCACAETLAAALRTPALPSGEVGAWELRFGYTNWEGRNSERRVRPISVRYGQSKWHPHDGWLMLAFDIDKNEEREFSMRDMVMVERSDPIALASSHTPPSAGDVRETLDHRQRVVIEWGERCFGPNHMRDKIIRAARFFEEAVELVQAIGLSREHAMRAFDYVYSREAGDPRQEAGGVANTLMALCGALDMSFDDCQQFEIERCLAKDPAEFARRNETKLREVDAGPSLPQLQTTPPFSRWADIIKSASLAISPKGSEVLDALAAEVRTYAGDPT